MPKREIFDKIFRLFIVITILFGSNSLIDPIKPVKAAIELSIVPITWNVIGLDSNNVNVGPNNFPVGARVCNTGSTAISGMSAKLVWDNANSYVDIRAGSQNPIEISGLAAGSPSNPSCNDFYFEVSVVRDSAAFDTTRQYHIEVSSTESTPEFSTISTVTPREVYVEHLISQNRNSTDNVSYALGANVPQGSLTPVVPGGTMSLMVGNTYTIRLDASTATQGYNQLEDFINFPNTVFQILSVNSTYTANSSGYVANSSDMLYADACLWDMDPTSETYLSCIGSDGKVGGTISTTYNVKIIGGAGTSSSLNTLIYDFSGSSFHYNSDFSSSSRYVTIESGVSLVKSFTAASIAPGGTSTLTLDITNLTGTPLTGISLTDNLPASPAQMVVASPTGADATDTDCLSPTFSPSPSDTSLTFTGGVAANSTCTIKVNVTANTVGTYVNTTEELMINDVNSGITASANLMVETTPSSSCTDVTIAEWSNFSTYNTMPPNPSINNTGGNAIAFYSGTQGTNNGTWWYMQDASTIDGDTLTSAKNYWRFQISTAGFSNVKMSFNYAKSATQSAEFLDVYYGNNATFTPAPTKFTTSAYVLTVNQPSFQTASGLNFTGLTNTTGDTYFYIFPYGAQNSGGVWTGINNISFTACVPLYSIQKSFSPDPIRTGDTSVLTFTLNNADTSTANLVSFSDTLPDGMTITSTPASSTCGGTLTATSGTSEISLVNGSIPASSNCTIAINVTTTNAGVYPNTSSYLTVNGTSLNSKAVDTLTVLDPPVISKAFSPNPIYAGNTSTLTFTIQNPNTNQALSGVSFTDTFPANLTLAATPTTPQCGGTITSTSGSITLSGGTLAAGDTCTVTASVTSSTVGEYANTSGAVSATETGNGNTASDTLVVQAVHPGIAILKEVSTSTNGPWANRLSVAPSGDVYYRITVENIGDVPLTSINVTDVSSPVNTTVDTAITSCSWPSVLPVGSSTTNPSATCVVGPFTAVTGTNDNTATAHGTYNGTVYNSDPDTATYATTSLSLDKTVTEPSFTAAGDALNFTYTITNASAAPISGVFQLNDTNLSNFSCTLDGSLINVGDTVNLAANNAGNDDTIVCTGVYTVTAFDVSVGSVTNTAYATVGTTRTNFDRVTVFSDNPDLIVAKTNNANNNATVGTAFLWSFRVTNQGPSSAPAVFTAGQTILSDALPSGATYSISYTPSEISNVSCAIDGSNVLTCSASGGSVTIPGNNGYFTVGVSVTPTTAGNLSNSQAIVDPNSLISESNEGNNIAGDAVNVTSSVDLVISKDDGVSNVSAGATVSYSIVVTNNGPSAANGAVFSDPAVSNLTVTGVTCGTAINGAACPAVGDTTVTLMQGVGIVIPTLPAAGSVTFTVTGTAGASGSMVNTAYVNPPSGTADSNMSNNTSTDTDSIGGGSADLSIDKDDSVTNVTAGGTVSYTVVVTNNGPSSADGAIFTDPSVSNLTVNSVTCTGTTGSAVCPAVGDTTVTLLQGTGIIIPTLPSGGTITFTVSGTAGASGSIVNTASIAPPSGTTDPTPGNNSESDTDTIDPSADLSIDKDDSVTNVAAGGTVSYTVVVTNNGPSSADGAIFTDPSVSNLTVNSVTCTGTTGSAVCPAVGDTTVTLLQGSGIIIPTLPSGGTVTFTVSGTAGASGSIVNTASITPPSGTTDPTPSNNSESDTDTIDPSADLSIDKDDSTSTVLSGGTVTYTILISNNGPSAADGAVFTDPAVSNLTVNSVTCGSETGSAVCPAVGDTTVTLLQGTGIIIPTLPSGGSVTFTVSGTAGTSGSIVNAASIAPPSGTTDPTPGNNSDPDTDTIGTASADLSITKDDSASSVTAGSTVSYSIVVSNAGTSSADGAIFTDPSVSNLTVNSVTCGSPQNGAACPAVIDTTVTLMQGTGIIIPTLPSSGSVTFTVSGTAGASGSIVNTASIAPPSGTTDPTPGNNSDTDTDTIDPSADLVVTKTNSLTSVAAGSTVSYTIVVTNNGPSAADDAVLTDPSVSNLTVSSVTCGSPVNGAVCPTSGNTTVGLLQGTGIIIPTLPSTGSVTFTIQGTAGTSGSVDNTATVAPPSGTSDPNLSNNSETDSDPITPSADLSISKTDGATDVITGATVSYTIVVSNNGPSAANGAIFTDPVVANLTVSSVTCDSASGGAACPTVANTTVALMQSSGIIISTLPSGGSVTFTVAGTAGTTGTIANTAAIAPPSGTTDPTPGNNSDTDNDTIVHPALTLAKSGTPTTYDTVGSTISYSYVITNSGDVTMSQPFTVSDDHIASVTCPSTPTTLAPLATITCTGTGTITQADLDAGSLTNTASASGNYNGTTITSPTDSETVNATQTSSVGLAKALTSGPTEISGNPGVYRITFTFVVENFGNVTLSNLQVTDNLATAFAGTNGIGENNTITVTSLTSSDFAVNWPGYNGNTDQNLLAGTDSLAGMDSGTITMIVEFRPVISGDYDNTASVRGTPPSGPNETDTSQTGNDPDPDHDDDPTNNNDPTTVSIGANIFDPPSGEKIYSDSGYPLLRWTAVWINADNVVAIHVRSTDEVPSGSTFYDDGVSNGTGVPAGAPAGSHDRGVTCTPASALTTVEYCYYENSTPTYPRGRVIWIGNLGPDYGATNASTAANEIVIEYSLILDGATTSLQNIMEIDQDTNNDNDFGDPGEAAVASASRIWPDSAAVAGASVLPNSGFPVGDQAGRRDSGIDHPFVFTSNMRLSIPVLDVDTTIVGIPYKNDEWNVTWLNDEAGWLNGTAFPTWEGNSVITGHVWDAYNQPGIFYDLKKLSYGDKIQIELYGSIYTYEVRENRLVLPDRVNLVLRHENTSWITLVTCEGYQGDEGDYQYRRVVRSVLVKVE